MDPSANPFASLAALGILIPHTLATTPAAVPDPGHGRGLRDRLSAGRALAQSDALVPQDSVGRDLSRTRMQDS